jgi:transcriptional regulator with XRE-family HTH domain
MNLTTPAQLGDAVRTLRQQRRLTQQQLAAQATMSRQYLVGLEHGTVNPTWDVVARLAAALDVDVTFDDRLTTTQLPPSDLDPTDLDAVLDAHRRRR